MPLQPHRWRGDFCRYDAGYHRRQATRTVCALEEAYFAGRWITQSDPAMLDDVPPLDPLPTTTEEPDPLGPTVVLRGGFDRLSDGDRADAGGQRRRDRRTAKIAPISAYRPDEVPLILVLLPKPHNPPRRRY